MGRTLVEKLAKIRRMTEFQEKTKKGFNYTYVPDYQILAKITAGLYTHKVDFYPSIVPGTLNVTPVSYTKKKYDKNTKTWFDEDINEVIVQAEMKYEWVNLEDPTDRMTSNWALVGQQSDASQALGSGLTYCMRYYMLKFFKVSTTDDDPDALRANQSEAYVGALIDNIDELARGNLNDDNRVGYAEIVKKYARDNNGKPTANYFDIGNISSAEKLLKATIEYFNITEE